MRGAWIVPLMVLEGAGECLEGAGRCLGVRE